MRFVLTDDAGEFARRTERLLAEHQEYNVLATVLMNVRDGLYADAAPRFAFGLDERGTVGFAALCTPPWPLLVTELEPGFAPAFTAAWLEVAPDITGVNGPATTSHAIAQAWSAQTGRHPHRRMRQALHVLDEVSDPPRPAIGGLRLPREAERPLLVTWLEAFIAETGMAGAGRAGQMIGTHLARDALMVWEDREPVAMVIANPVVAGVVRVGMVYTPPAQRRRGYAGTAVAAISRRALEAGARTCQLFTDLANPTSNKIYAEVGYRRVAEWEEWELSG